VAAIDDQIPPQFDSLGLTKVTGQINDSSVTIATLKIAGRPDQTVPVTEGAFTFMIAPGAAEVTIEAVNGAGQTFSRKVRLVP
jgi:hypothetical protein